MPLRASMPTLRWPSHDQAHPLEGLILRGLAEALLR